MLPCTSCFEPQHGFELQHGFKLHAVSIRKQLKVYRRTQPDVCLENRDCGSRAAGLRGRDRPEGKSGGACVVWGGGAEGLATHSGNRGAGKEAKDATGVGMAGCSDGMEEKLHMTYDFTYVIRKIIYHL